MIHLVGSIPNPESLVRTLFIYRANGDSKVLDGLVNTKYITNKNFYDMIEILLVFDSKYTLARARETIRKDDATNVHELRTYRLHSNLRVSVMHIRRFADLSQGLFPSTMSFASSEQSQ